MLDEERSLQNIIWPFTCQSTGSHRFVMTDDFMAVLAAMLVIVAGRDVEWNDAAAAPAAE